MKQAYLLYSESDAAKNQSFIEQLQQTGLQHDVTLTLLIEEQHDIIKATKDALFIWNRTRNAELAKQLEQLGHRVVNRSEVNRIANDKLRAMQLAILQGIPTVPRVLEQRLTADDFPIIVKSTGGHGGNEVFKCDTLEQFKTAKEKLTTYLIEPYIETNATDVRVWMIGEVIIGAVKRIGAPGDFRSNYTLGGSIEKFDLTAEQRTYVQRIQKAIKSDYIGIDFLHVTQDQLLFNEMEDPVGARSYYELFDKDLTELLWQHLLK